MGEVLFVSAVPLGRCKSTTRIWDMYDGPKTFRCGVERMCSAERDGFSVVVCDSLPRVIEDKDKAVSVNLGHGLTGGKRYGLDEGVHPWVDRRALGQIDYAIATSEAGIPIVAGQLGISVDNVLPLGMARTDAYFEPMPEKPKGRIYLYCPTFRGLGDKGHLPRIDWAKVDGLLEDDETLVVKRHHLTQGSLTHGDFKHISEFPPATPTELFLLGCDVLITDYSSTMFDAMLLGKPVVLVVDDMREYLAGRGMYYEFPDFYSPRWLGVEGQEELLVLTLRDAAEKGVTDVERKCLEAVAGACDGHSTERICELIRSLA